MTQSKYDVSFQISEMGALQKCVKNVAAHMDTGEEQVFKVRLVLNELLASMLECSGDEQSIHMQVECLNDRVSIVINNAGAYTRQFVRCLDRTPVCGNVFEEDKSRLMLVWSMADELMYNVKNGRLTVVVSTA